MIKRTFLVFVLLLFPSITFAGEYVLVMSKEDNVCQHMLGLYNEDLKKYGEIKYDEHEEFKAIKWEVKRYFTTYPDGKKDYSIMDYRSVVMSRFDINNDGKEEIVIKFIGEWKGSPADSLYFFKSEYSDYFKDEFDVNGLYLKAIGAAGTMVDTMAFRGNAYYLKELPKIPIGIISGKEAYSHYSLGGWFFVNPFVFKEAYYINMRDNSSEAKFLVILKYTKDNQPKDICYYLKVSDCNNKK